MVQQLSPRRKAAMIVGPVAAAPAIVIHAIHTYSANPFRTIAIAGVSFVVAFLLAAYVALTWLPRYSDGSYEPEE
jgi:hypothetical protein